MSQRVLLYTDDSGEGGVASYNHSLLCHLATVGYQVAHAQGAGESRLIHQQRACNIQQIDLGFTAGQDPARSLKDFENARQLLLAAQPDLVFFSDGWAFSNFAAKQAAIELNIPHITILHWIEPSCAAFSYGDGVPYIDVVSYHYSRAKAVLAVSQNTLNSMRQIFKVPDTAQVIYNGIPAQYFAPRNLSTRAKLRQTLGIPEEAIVCFTSARLATVKGHQYQLEAIQQLNGLRSTGGDRQLYFLWAGTGAGNKYIDAEAQIKESIRKLGLGNQVKLLGQRDDIPELLDASDIFVLTSKAEGMPLSIMEAMAKGLPVVATAVSGVPEELGETGRLLPNPNVNSEATVQALVETLQAWSADPQLRRSIGLACQQRAATLFTEARMLDETTRAIDRALSQPLEQPNASQDLHKRLHYGFLTWTAWRSCRNGEPEVMLDALQASLKNTPFALGETILNWVENFAKFSLEQSESFDTYDLINSDAWEKILRSTRLQSKAISNRYSQPNRTPK